MAGETHTGPAATGAPRPAIPPLGGEPGAGVSATELGDTTSGPARLEDGASQSRNGSHQMPDIESSPLAWACVFGAFLFLIPSYGFMQAVGVIQSYLQTHQLSAYSARDIGWIPGMLTFLALLLGIQIGPVLDVYGSAHLAPAAALVLSAMFFLLAECTAYWHFMLCLGVLGGLGGALASTVAMSCVAKLFARRRGLALGVTMSGSSTGAIVISLMLRGLFPALGWAWTIRALGFFVTGIMAIGVFCLLPYPRLVATRGYSGPPSSADPIPLSSAAAGPRPSTSSPQSRAGPPSRQDGRTHPKRSASLNFSAFQSAPFAFITAALFLMEFVLYGISGLLPTFAIVSGFPADMGYYLVAIANGCSFLGRILPGLAGDHLGHFNVLLLTAAFSIVTLGVVLVPFGSRSVGALYAFSALWGFASGSCLSLTPVCMGKTCHPKDYGRYFGTMNFVVSFSLLICIPIGGQMLETMGPMALSGFYLAIAFLSGVCCFGARSLLAGSLTDFKLKI